MRRRNVEHRRASATGAARAGVVAARGAPSTMSGWSPTAYAYSAAVALGLSGKALLWELATLIDVMLLGGWNEIRSLMGASSALESRVPQALRGPARAPTAAPRGCR